MNDSSTRDAVAIFGLACIVLAAFLVSTVIGFVVLGICLIFIAVIMSLAVTRGPS